MPSNTATLIFTDDEDGGLSAQILFEPKEFNQESNAHIAAVIAYQFVTKKVDEASNESSE